MWEKEQAGTPLKGGFQYHRAHEGIEKLKDFETEGHGSRDA